jgi:3-deoxy-D-manno-octulosonate 8-phosphate phosphatase (KDO 8-P phosphatase)
MSEPALLSVVGRDAEPVRMVVFDFDGVFTDNTVWTDASGNESVRSWRGDGLGLQKLRDLDIPVWVLSTETNEVVARRCEKLRIPFRQGLTDKAEALEGLAAELGIAMAEIAYVGNDINDAPCLQLVGTPIVVADAHADVMPLARYRTKAHGGLGAVREVCDWLAAESRSTIRSS